jgi:hypothetical protein
MDTEPVILNPETEGYIVLSDSDYAKAIGQFRLAVGAVLGAFDMYGMGVFIKGAQDEIVKLAEDFGLRVRGFDKPISINYVRRNQ